MRALFWIVVIFALAAGLVAAARYDTGYVLLVLPSHRVEFSLNLLLIGLFAAFVAMNVLLRIIAGTLRLPVRVREYRLERRRRSAEARLLEALREFFAGRYARAEKAAAASLRLGEHVGPAALLAARSAHGLRAFGRRDGYLAQAAALAPEDEDARIMSQAEFLLEQHRHEEALEVLKALPRKHTAALRLELKAHQAARNWDEVLPLIDPLEKRGVFDAGQAEQIRRHAVAENLQRKALDLRTLEETWQKMPARHRKDHRVAAAAAQCFMALGACGRVHEIVAQSLDETWDSGLIPLYADCEGGDTLKRIERAEGWLKREPHDAALLLTLGRLCMQQGLWGKAQSYLEASLAIEPTCGAHLALAQLYEKLGNGDEAQRHYRDSLDHALAQLRQSGGGRRRITL